MPAGPMLGEFPKVIVVALTVFAPAVDSLRVPCTTSAGATPFPVDELTPSEMLDPAVPVIETELAADRSRVAKTPVPVWVVAPLLCWPITTAPAPRLSAKAPPVITRLVVSPDARVVTEPTAIAPLIVSVLDPPAMVFGVALLF